MRALLDVNVLIALLDGEHLHHRLAAQWLQEHGELGWASCPLTQNGCLRIISLPTYPHVQEAALVAQRLTKACAHPSHAFWPDSLSLLDDQLVRSQREWVIGQLDHGIVAADPRIFPLARYVEVFLGNEYLGRYLVDDTGGNVLGATLDIWNPDCKEAARFGRHWGAATLVAREVEQIPNDSLAPSRWDGLAKR